MRVKANKISKIAIVPIVSILVLLSISSVVTAQHQQKDFSVKWRRIEVYQIENDGLRITENFSIQSQKENAEIIILMVDQNFENFSVEENLEENRADFYIKLRLENSLEENREMVMHARYYLPDLPFYRPIYYDCENVIVYAKNFDNSEIENSVPLGHPFSARFGDNISIIEAGEGGIQPPPSGGINLTVLAIAAGLIALLAATYVNRGRIREWMAPEEKVSARDAVLERLESDFRGGKIPEEAYRDILSDLEEESGE
ncbi:hypothetical protein AKJ48_02920 [candidate division MSBL1 archaeon SCGC-AAA261O19]|uniref:Uncharacterized protein n=1 Tax=candidate division MSBL1 archaeon SCGC-AAA261O19 TaxID=1698277 RepID=A0A133VD05_9EURY|nr:hypothetical protein AKJ48_02920 [candidate division MSBL1 archaeon SCGC-AAA261O19]